MLEKNAQGRHFGNSLTFYVLPLLEIVWQLLQEVYSEVFTYSPRRQTSSLMIVMTEGAGNDSSGRKAKFSYETAVRVFPTNWPWR